MQLWHNWQRPFQSFVCLKPEYCVGNRSIPYFCAFFPCVAKPSADMVFTMYDGRVLVFYEYAIWKPAPWASYQIRKIAVCACAGNAGNVFPHRRFRRRPLVSDPGMHHGTCVTHVPWCMSGSLTCGGGENVPGACAPAILRIWQEAHTSAKKWVENVDTERCRYNTVNFIQIQHKRHLIAPR